MAKRKSTTRGELVAVLGERSAARAIEAFNLYKSLLKDGDYSFYDLNGLRRLLPSVYGDIDNTCCKGLVKSGDNFLEYTVIDPKIGECSILPGVIVGCSAGIPNGCKRKSLVEDIDMLIPISGIYGYMASLSHFMRDGVRAKLVRGDIILIKSGSRVSIEDVYKCIYPIKGSSGIPILELEGLF